MSPLIPKVLVSKVISRGTTIKGVNITVYYTGTLNFQITADADAASPTWDLVTLTTGIKKAHTFTTSGTVVKYRIIGSAGAVIQTQKNVTGSWIAPGIKIELIHT